MGHDSTGFGVPALAGSGAKMRTAEASDATPESAGLRVRSGAPVSNPAQALSMNPRLVIHPSGCPRPDRPKMGLRTARPGSWSQDAISESSRLSMNRSLSSAGFQPAVSPTFSRPGVRLRERVQVAGHVRYARRLRVENPSILRSTATEDGRYRRLESLRYGVHGFMARPFVWRRSSPRTGAGFTTNGTKIAKDRTGFFFVAFVCLVATDRNHGVDGW